jgi:hypothetical protein
MGPELAAAISNGENWLPRVFTGPFVTKAGWVQYIGQHFPDLDTASILNQTLPWQRQHFQALYVACWIHQPLLKGTYMLRLAREQYKVAKKGFEQNLKSRWSTHLTTNIDGASAGGDDNPPWEFLRNYRELLVKVEELHGFYYLMLKCEGHTTDDSASAGDKFNHAMSAVTKIFTGEGNDVNPDFVELLKSDEGRNLGISRRSAENYSDSYKKLLETLPKAHLKPMKKTMKHGEIVAVHEAVAGMVTRCNELLEAYPHFTRLAARFNQKLDRVGGRHAKFETLSNPRLAQALEAVLEFTDNSPVNLAFSSMQENIQVMIENVRHDVKKVRAHKFVKALRNARPDLQKIVAALKVDPRTTVRYFQEVTLDPEMLDRSLHDAWELLY